MLIDINNLKEEEERNPTGGVGHSPVQNYELVMPIENLTVCLTHPRMSKGKCRFSRLTQTQSCTDWLQTPQEFKKLHQKLFTP